MCGISAAHLEMTLDAAPEVCYTEENSVKEHSNDDEHPLYKKISNAIYLPARRKPVAD